MATEENSTPSVFAWNAGGWFGAQFGSTLWVLILGFVLFRKDALAAWICVASFLVLNVWGMYLWRNWERLAAYAGLQRFLLAAGAIIALVVVVVNNRGLSEPPEGLVSTYLPYWVVAVDPAVMLLFFLRERKARQGQR